MAVFDSSGKVIEEHRFETAKDYQQFLDDFETNFALLKNQDLLSAVVAVPGKLDREHGRALGFGTLLWPEVNIEADIEKTVNCPVIIENDTKLAGLSEANLIINEFKRVLYVTISTGISDALIVDGKLDPAMADSEGGQMWLEHNGKRIQWEDLASGKAIVNKYGVRAEEINDPEAWAEIALNISVGLHNLIVVIQPEVIVLGGGVGQYFDKFSTYLLQDLKKLDNPLTPIPPIHVANRPEEAVIYGAFILAKQRFGANSKAKVEV